jgi:Tfp pilus assembly protein PilN
MRAVNLMPRDGHGRPGSSPFHSGSAVYALLAGLVALVALVAVWATANKQIGDRETKLQRVSAEVSAAERRAGDAAPYVAFAKLANDRVQTVSTLSATRFDWAHAMHEVSRVLPADVWLTSLDGTSGATGAAPTTTASAAPAPTFEFVGCTGTQTKVARLMARLRAVDGVRDVDLKTSEKPDAGGDKDCPANAASDPKFTIVITFKAPGSAKDEVDATGQVVTAQAASPTTATTAAAAGTAPATTAAPSTPSTASSPATSER